jgi:alkanesulfonate monooxygenase SsuD/methylene tetrahydromethanopterin reductase-like flavin-dependent oxidoreductase (luciferase family)
VGALHAPRLRRLSRSDPGRRADGDERGLDVPGGAGTLRDGDRLLVRVHRRALQRYIVEHYNGIPFRKPYQYTRDTALFLREALSGAKITKDYECFSVKGFRLRREVPEPPPILLGALRPGMLELAGRVGDGAILNWVSPEDLPQIIPHVKKHGQDREIAVRTVICPTDDVEKARAVARMWIAGYFQVEAYKQQQKWLGRGPQLEQMWKLWQEGDRGGSMQAIPDEVVDGFYFIGDPDKIKEDLRRFFDNGADTVIIASLETACDPREAARVVAPGAR